MKSYYAAGKVMLIGEYAVKLGIEALALPVRKGQHLRVWEYDSPSEDTFIYQAFDNEGARFVDLQLKLPFVAADLVNLNVRIWKNFIVAKRVFAGDFLSERHD